MEHLAAPPSGTLPVWWRIAVGSVWAGIIAGFASVWNSSRLVGLSTWWLGAEAFPRSIFVQLLPFYLPLLTVVAMWANVRFGYVLGALATVASAVIAAGDLHRVARLAAVEFTLAAAGLLITVASLAGLRRPLTAR